MNTNAAWDDETFDLQVEADNREWERRAKRIYQARRAPVREAQVEQLQERKYIRIGRDVLVAA